MQQSVKEIRDEVKEKNKTRLNIKDPFKYIVNIMMNQVSDNGEYAQMNYKKGIKVHGKLAIEAMLREYAQMGEGDNHVFIPMIARTLTREQKQKALRLISLIKKKRCGKVKGRIVADGSKQRPYMRKEDVGSPTVHLENLIDISGDRWI